VISGHQRGADLHQFLGRLAVIEAKADPQARRGLEAGMLGDVLGDDVLRDLNLGSTGEYNIVLTARPQGSFPTALWNSSYFIFIGESQKPATLRENYDKT
jgi:hypothetical protein